jgi:phosphoglycerate dehydrogenase-like enzyme
MTASPVTRILMAGDHVAGLRDAIARARPELEIRLKPLGEIGAPDLDWAQVFIGFRKPPVGGWGAVRWIHSIGAGVDGLVFRKGFPPGILLTKSGEDFGPAIGEWCLARALAENQFLGQLAADQRERRWVRSREPLQLRTQRVLILGTGQVGRGIARAFRALGAVVIGLSRSGRPVADFDRVVEVTRFADEVRQVQWLILAAPLTEETRGWLNRERLAQCGGVYLMNVGRGAVIDERALPEALDRDCVRGAALDVFEQEPLPPESPLWDHPRVTISPHISGPSTLTATTAGFLECLAAVERGERPRLAVDPARGY